MGYNRENYRRIKHEYDGKNLRVKEEAERRTKELHQKIPELEEIDAALSETGLKLFKTSLNGREGLTERIAELRKENLEMQKIRAECLKYHGYPEDYTAPKYECTECMDTGFIGTKICTCMKKKLILAGFESSGISELIKTQSFETFSLNYYKSNPQDYEAMKNILNFCKSYSDKFSIAADPSSAKQNLLLCGHTGLGKTHISTSIAKVVIERGFDVVYETAQNLMSDFEYERFGRGFNEDADELRTDKYFSCELLIIDDLGTEMANQFTIASLYNILNTRLNRRLPVIINTNLTQVELRKRYADRITSRLFGEFIPLQFKGNDVRAQNLAKR